MKEKIEEIKYLRVIGCLAVILIHTSAEPVTQLAKGSMHLAAFSLLNRALQFAVPLFIFISGFVLYYNYQARPGFSYGEFLKKRLSGVLLPYGGWTLVYYFFFIAAGYYTFSWPFLLKKLLLADMVYHLYFVLLIVQFYILFGVFLYLFKKVNNKLLLSGILVINILFLQLFYFPYVDRFFLQYVVFFALGCYFAGQRAQVKDFLKSRKYYLFVFYLLIVGYFTAQFYQYQVLKVVMDSFTIKLTWLFFNIISIIFVYYLAISFQTDNNRLKKIISQIDAASFHIYLAHPLALMVSQRVLKLSGFYSLTGSFLINTLVVILTVIPFSILYGHLKKKVKNVNA